MVFSWNSCSLLVCIDLLSAVHSGTGATWISRYMFVTWIQLYLWLGFWCIKEQSVFWTLLCFLQACGRMRSARLHKNLTLRKLVWYSKDNGESLDDMFFVNPNAGAWRDEVGEIGISERMCGQAVLVHSVSYPNSAAFLHIDTVGMFQWSICFWKTTHRLRLPYSGNDICVF